jgi:hypothetical protein
MNSAASDDRGALLFVGDHTSLSDEFTWWIADGSKRGMDGGGPGKLRKEETEVRDCDAPSGCKG